MLVGAFKVSFVPDVKPLIVRVRSEGIVSVCVDVTVQGGGLAAVDVIEQDWAATIWALATTAQAAAPATTNFRMERLRLKCLATSLKRPCSGCPRSSAATRPDPNCRPKALRARAR